MILLQVEGCLAYVSATRNDVERSAKGGKGLVRCSRGLEVAEFMARLPNPLAARRALQVTTLWREPGLAQRIDGVGLPARRDARLVSARVRREEELERISECVERCAREVLAPTLTWHV